MTPILVLVGTAKQVPSEESLSGGFIKATLTIDCGKQTSEKCSSDFDIEFFGKTLDKLREIDDIVGKTLLIKANLKARQYQNKTYYNLVGVDVEVIHSTYSPTQKSQITKSPQPSVEELDIGDDDLPF